MPGDEYAGVPGGSGALKLKGAKVNKKKKKKDKTSLERNLEGGEKSTVATKKKKDDDDAKREEDEDEAEAEAESGPAYKTESERRFEEARRKKLLQMSESSVMKTHKERVEELNTYLSKLSEHHDMPKIGPG